ncbi:MAG: hypothetical protein IPN53_10945 [Comamonadaceae bacterium]|nr:hypothetical protein [Comamonadaceae bacterium]
MPSPGGGRSEVRGIRSVRSEASEANRHGHLSTQNDEIRHWPSAAGRTSVRLSACRTEARPTADQPPTVFHIQPLSGKTIAVARDAAFCFIYEANLDCLRDLGAALVFFSPLHDAAVPDCDALWLPGGYPELHAQALSANTPLRDSLAAHVAAGLPVWAECGGMMVLFDTLITADGERYAQWGLLPGTVTMHQRLAALGPLQLGLKSGTLRGHTFHYSTTETLLQPVAHTARPDSDPLPDAGEAVWQQGSVRASYFHAWFASCPAAVVELFSPPASAAASGERL